MDRLLIDPATLVASDVSANTRENYVDCILRGGLPLAVGRTSIASRNRWFDDYVT